MSLKLTRTLFIIFAAAAPAAFVDLPVRVTYNPERVTVEYLGTAFSQTFYNTQTIHPAATVHIYYLDAKDSSTFQSTGKNINDLLRRVTWSRPEADVQAEFLKDQEIGVERADAMNEWKRTNKHKRVKDPKPVFSPQPIDAPVTFEVTIHLDNFREVFKNNLQVRVVENSLLQVVIVLFYYQSFDLASIHSRANGDTAIKLNYREVILGDLQAVEYLHSLQQPPRVLNGHTMDLLPSSAWVQPSDTDAFIIFVVPTIVGEVIIKTAVEDQTCILMWYQENTEFRMRYTPHTAYLSLRLEVKNSPFQSNLRLPIASRDRSLKLTFKGESGATDTVLDVPLSRRGVFNLASDLLDGLRIKYGHPAEYYPYLRLDKSGVEVEVEAGAQFKLPERLVLKVVEAGHNYRVSAILNRQYLGNSKRTFWVPRTYNKPIRFFWTAPQHNPPKAYQLHFDRKLPIDLAFLKKKHYEDFTKSVRLFTNTHLTAQRPPGVPDTQPLIDFAWADKFEAFGEKLSRDDSHPFIYQRRDSCDVFFYKRYNGFFVKVDGAQVTLFSFTETNGEYSVDHVLSVDHLAYNPDLKVSAAVIDVDNNMNVFNYEGFAVLAGELYFLKVPTDMQEQLNGLHPQVCKSTFDTMVICLFSVQRSFEVDVTKGKFTFWDRSRPVEFLMPRFGYAIEPLFLKPKKCTVPKKQKFEVFPSEHSDKYFVEWDDNRFVDLAHTTVHCDDAIATCFVIFVDGNPIDLTKEVLSTLNVDLKTRTCTFQRAEELNLKIHKEFLTVYPEKGPGAFNLRFNKPLAVLKDFKHLFVGDKGIRLNCLRKEADIITGNCFSLHAALPDRGGIFRDALLRPDAHPLNIPFYFLREEGNFLSLEPHYTAGRLSVKLSFSSFELSVAGQDTSLGSGEFVRTKVYQKSSGFVSATLKLFLFELIPVVVPLRLSRFTNFKRDFESGVSLDLEADFPGNVDDFFVYSVFERVSSGEYALYCIENDKNEMEILVYRASDLAVYEVVDQLFRPEAPDLEKVLYGPKRNDDKNAEFMIDFAKLVHGDQFFGYETNTFFHRIVTVYPGAEVVLIRKDALPKRKAALSLMMYFYESSEANKVLGYVSSPEEFEGQGAADAPQDRRRRLI